MREIIVNADNKSQALKRGSKKRFLEGGSLTIPAVATNARPHPKMNGKYIVSIRKDKRY